MCINKHSRVNPTGLNPNLVCLGVSRTKARASPSARLKEPTHTERQTISQGPTLEGQPYICIYYIYGCI